MGDDPVAQLADQLEGRHAEQAWQTLVELGPALVPRLVDLFAQSSSADVRRSIVEIIAQFRRPEDLHFFGTALSDPVEPVWQAAIDGLVSQPNESAFGILCLALTREQEHAGRTSRRARYLAEAVSELQHSSPFGVPRT